MPDCDRAQVCKNLEILKEKSISTNEKPRKIIKDIIKDNDDDVLAKNPSHSALTQVIRRERKKNK